MTGSVRTQARRKAAEVKRTRLEALLKHEADVEAAVASFEEHRLRASQTIEAAQARAKKILDDGHERAARFEREANAAIAALAELGESRQSIAALTGLPLSGVRSALLGDGAESRPTAKEVEPWTTASREREPEE